MCLNEEPRLVHHQAALHSIREHHQQTLAQIPRGALAVIHPRRETPGGVSCRLHLYPQPAQGMLAYAVLSTTAGGETTLPNLENHHIYVHQDGDLSRSGTWADRAPLIEFPACAPHSWRVQDDAAGLGDSIVSPIAAHVDLSVGWPGNTGIIGRRVSIINPAGRVAGDGVVGWN